MGMMFGDIGFDKPGKHGLSYDSFMAISALYIIALIAGLVLSIKKHQWTVLVLQIIPVAVGLSIFTYNITRH